jgi:hypothetical protein
VFHLTADKPAKAYWIQLCISEMMFLYNLNTGLHQSTGSLWISSIKDVFSSSILLF